MHEVVVINLQEYLGAIDIINLYDFINNLNVIINISLNINVVKRIYSSCKGHSNILINYIYIYKASETVILRKTINQNLVKS